MNLLENKNKKRPEQVTYSEKERNKILKEIKNLDATVAKEKKNRK